MASSKSSKKTDEKLNAEKALVKTIADAGASELLIKAGESFLDSITSNEAVREIPIIRTLIGLNKARIGVLDYLLTKKIVRFLQGTSEKAREKFLLRIKRDKKFEEKLGETLFLLLERLDDMDKPELIGLFFTEFLEGKLTFDEFLRLSRAIERVFLPDLKELRNIADVGGVDYDENHFFSANAEISLLNAGLIQIYTAGQTPDILISPVGDLMVEILYGKPTPKRMLGDWACGKYKYTFNKWKLIFYEDHQTEFGKYSFVEKNKIEFTHLQRTPQQNANNKLLIVKIEQGIMYWMTMEGEVYLTWRRLNT